MPRPPAAVATLPTEEIPCPLCGSNGGKILSVQMRRFGVVKCQRCRLVRLSPRVAASVRHLLYDDVYFAGGGYDDYAATYARFRHIYEKLFAARLRLVQRFLPARGHLLECGCAHGFQLEWLRRQGWDVTGNELSPAAARYAREELGVDIITGPLETTPLPPKSFDLIYLIDLVEHLYDPDAALANVRSALRDKGVVLVQTPYELFHWEKIAQALWEGKRPGAIAPDAVPYHVTFFNPRTLALLLIKNGFKILKRASGNYGAVRRFLSPPQILTANPLETTARFVYYRLGLRRALQQIALVAKQGSGIIYVARRR